MGTPLYVLFCIMVSIIGLRCEEEAHGKLYASYDPATVITFGAPLSNFGDATACVI